jgi:hypothetical protein
VHIIHKVFPYAIFYGREKVLEKFKFHSEVIQSVDRNFNIAWIEENSSYKKDGQLLNE